MFRPATLPLAACALLMAGLAQAQTQSPAPPATIRQGPSTTTSFTPAAPIYLKSLAANNTNEPLAFSSEFDDSDAANDD